MIGAADAGGSTTTTVGRGTEVTMAENDEFELVELGPEDLPAVTALIGSRPDSVTRWVGVRQGDALVGAASWLRSPEGIRLLRIVVEPELQRQGLGTALVAAIEELGALEAQVAEEEFKADDSAGRRPFSRAAAPARRIFVDVADHTDADWLRSLGYVGMDERLSRALPTVVSVPTAAAMHNLGLHLASLVHPGDLLILTGDLGAGKTTLTQGIGHGLGVEDPVTSPTFVLSRVYPGGEGRPDLVHVDAYRMESLHEIDDIDLDSDLERSVTVVEWGAGVAEQLADERLDITIRRGATDEREVVIRGTGPRWNGISFAPDTLEDPS